MNYRTSDAICGIYEIINTVNGKRYIGQSINILNRWKEHQRSLNKNTSKCRLLQRAWNKYGEASFIMNVLEVCSEGMLDALEIKYINLYDTVNNGYNIESGGNSQKHLSEETKQLISEARIGFTHTDEVKKKMSESRMGTSNSMYGKKHTEESKKKISDVNKGRTGHKISEKQKEICRTANLGKVVSEETRRKLSEAKIGNIPYNKNYKSVYCIELNKIFECPSDAGKYLNIHSSNIIACCENVRKTCGGFHWKYTDCISIDSTIQSHTNNTKLSPLKEAI